MDNDRKQGGKAKHLKETTVQEAKEQLASAKDGDTFVWGTRHEGTKEDFEAFLASRDDGDVLVWGN